MHTNTKGNEIEVVAMKLMKGCLIVVVGLCVVVSILVGGAYLLGVIVNVQSATFGVARYHLEVIGKSIARGLRENNAFPRDYSPANIDHEGGHFNRWHAQFNVEQMLQKYGNGTSDNDVPRVYFDPDIWTVIKNIPNDPPPNLVVLATRNVDPSSLRTRLIEKDMDKHIRFKEKKDPLWILNQTAVLVYADGVAFAFRPVTSSSRKPNRATFGHVYRDQPFDLTTNTINGLQVKYLTPDGEVTPTND